jgi:hypothetical protein
MRVVIVAPVAFGSFVIGLRLFAVLVVLVMMFLGVIFLSFRHTHLSFVDRTQ